MPRCSVAMLAWCPTGFAVRILVSFSLVTLFHLYPARLVRNLHDCPRSSSVARCGPDLSRSVDGQVCHLRNFRDDLFCSARQRVSGCAVFNPPCGGSGRCWKRRGCGGRSGRIESSRRSEPGTAADAAEPIDPGRFAVRVCQPDRDSRTAVIRTALRRPEREHRHLHVRVQGGMPQPARNRAVVAPAAVAAGRPRGGLRAGVVVRRRTARFAPHSDAAATEAVRAISRMPPRFVPSAERRDYKKTTSG